MPTFITIVLDGVGIGEQPDAAIYNDVGSNTLGHVCEEVGPALPNLGALGLGCIALLDNVPAARSPRAHFGKMCEVSAGKDSTTGHWELAGLMLPNPFPTYPNGFPATLIGAFVQRTGVAGVLGNRPDSGTVIIEALGEEHQTTSRPIVYTSADSVFQVAAHVDTIPLEDLYRMCAIAREEICIDAHGVGRVIARPFEGTPGHYRRISAKRKDFSILPDETTLQERLQAAGITTVSIGKVADLFGRLGFDEIIKTASNQGGIDAILRVLKHPIADDQFVWVNLVDFDQEFGHRNDPVGFARALEAFDQQLPAILAALPANSQLVITADHGNDPTTPSTDHSREYVPLLYVDGSDVGEALGTRSTFADHAATVLDFFHVAPGPMGESFLRASSWPA